MASSVTSSPAVPATLSGGSRHALAWGLLLGATLAAFLVPLALPVLALLPLVAALLALPSVPLASLRRLLVGAWGATALLAGRAAGSWAGEPGGAVVLAALVVAAASVALALVWQVGRERESFARTEQAHAGLKREATERALALQRLLADVEGRAHAQGALLNEVRQRTDELALLNEASDLLRGCRTPDEAHGRIAALLAGLFPDDAGQLCVAAEGRSTFKGVAQWGDATGVATLDQADCRALRDGREAAWTAGEEPPCPHLASTAAAATLCLPLRAQGETVGLLTLLAAAPLAEGKERMARMVAEQVALVLANLHLQERLRNQSVTDPLTGLYNRRYMEESLRREVRQVARSQRALSIIALDLDGLRRFNEAFGHEAGDSLLREVGAFLQQAIRGGDIACRYEDDCFVLILPGAPLDICERRAAQLCQTLATSPGLGRYAGEAMVTLSGGVASFPQHGVTGDSVLRAALTALAAAKTQGGNMVTVA